MKLLKHYYNLLNTIQYHFHKDWKNWGQFPLTTQRFANLNQDQLNDVHLINSLLQRPIPRISARALRGMYQGKIIKTGYQTCFSQKKSIRRWYPRVKHLYFTSDILRVKIYLPSTSAARKTMKKYGGFDNFILCAPPRLHKSNMVQYLRSLMIKKIENINFHPRYVLKTIKAQKSYIRQKKLYKKMFTQLVLPKDRAFQDITAIKYRKPQDMSRQNYKKYLQLQQLQKKYQDVSTDHPLLKQIAQFEEKETKYLMEQSKKAIEINQRYKKYKKWRKEQFENQQEQIYKSLYQTK